MAGGLGPAYAQTDVMHDRSYLISSLANPNRAVRKQAEAALADLDRQQALQQRDQYLQQQDAHFQAQQRRIEAHQNALEMDRQLKIDRDTEIDEQGHGLLLSMMQLDAAKRRGQITKDQYDQGILDAAAQFPMGLRHPEAKRHLEFVTKEADRQNEFNNRRQLSEATKLSAKFGVPVQTDPATGLPSLQHTYDLAAQTPRGQVELSTTRPAPEKIIQRYAHVVGAMEQRAAEQQADIKRQEGLNVAARKENVPYNPTYDVTSASISGGLKGYRTEKERLEAAYPQLNPNNSPSAQPAGAVPTTSQAAPAATPSVQQQDPESMPWNIPGVQSPDVTITPSPTPEATTPPAPVHLGTYNPATGEFE